MKYTFCDSPWALILDLIGSLWTSFYSSLNVIPETPNIFTLLNELMKTAKNYHIKKLWQQETIASTAAVPGAWTWTKNFKFVSHLKWRLEEFIFSIVFTQMTMNLKFSCGQRIWPTCVILGRFTVNEYSRKHNINMYDGEPMRQFG
jgi:hypothetical protein